MGPPSSRQGAKKKETKVGFHAHPSFFAPSFYHLSKVGMTMDKKRAILKILEKDGRATPEYIASELGISEEEVIASISELEADHVIAGYTAVIDYEKLDKDTVTALIEVKVVPQRGVGFDHIAMRIAKFEEVASIFLASGDFDFVVEVKGKSMKEASQFVFEKLSTLESVQSTATHFVLKKYKDHNIVIKDKGVRERDAIVL